MWRTRPLNRPSCGRSTSAAASSRLRLSGVAGSSSAPALDRSSPSVDCRTCIHSLDYLSIWHPTTRTCDCRFRPGRPTTASHISRRGAYVLGVPVRAVRRASSAAVPGGAGGGVFYDDAQRGEFVAEPVGFCEVSGFSCCGASCDQRLDLFIAGRSVGACGAGWSADSDAEGTGEVDHGGKPTTLPLRYLWCGLRRGRCWLSGRCRR